MIVPRPLHAAPRAAFACSDATPDVGNSAEEAGCPGLPSRTRDSVILTTPLDLNDAIGRSTGIAPQRSRLANEHHRVQPGRHPVPDASHDQFAPRSCERVAR
jgi:hypothetical protein